MTTLAVEPIHRDVPAGAVPVDPDGLLIGVQRPCPDHHAPRCGCVATASSGAMVFWCEAGRHHFSARSIVEPAE